MGRQEYNITKNKLFSKITIFLMMCLVAQANIPLPVLALSLYIITKILDVSRLRRALLVPLPFHIAGQIRTTFPTALPGLYIHLALVMVPWRVLILNRQ